MALDWSSSNWYFLDEAREVIYLCHVVPSKDEFRCLDVVNVRVSRPSAIALDPMEGKNLIRFLDLSLTSYEVITFRSFGFIVCREQDKGVN